MRPIVLTGPESTGKSTLSTALSEHYHYPVLKEYAREYLEEHPSTAYSFEEVILMAKEQWKREQEILETEDNACILDTDLTVYSIWIQEKYQHQEDWIEENIIKGKNKIYLLCDIDIPWTFDPLREHPSPEDRQRLFKTYQNLLEKYRLDYHIISGNIHQRVKKAVKIITNSQ